MTRYEILTESIACPYCGESFESVIELGGDDQTYIEDCYVCCRPITFAIKMQIDTQRYELTIKRDDE